MATKAELKAYFETGDTPTQAEFEELIDELVLANKPEGFLPFIRSGEIFHKMNGSDHVLTFTGRIYLWREDNTWAILGQEGIDSVITIPSNQYAYVTIADWESNSVNSSVDSGAASTPLSIQVGTWYTGTPQTSLEERIVLFGNTLDSDLSKAGGILHQLIANRNFINKKYNYHPLLRSGEVLHEFNGTAHKITLTGRIYLWREDNYFGLIGSDSADTVIEVDENEYAYVTIDNWDKNKGFGSSAPTIQLSIQVASWFTSPDSLGDRIVLAACTKNSNSPEKLRGVLADLVSNTAIRYLIVDNNIQVDPIFSLPVQQAKIKNFLLSHRKRDKDLSLILMGDSYFARTHHTTLYPDTKKAGSQSYRPPGLVAFNTASLLWNCLDWGNTIFRRWDAQEIDDIATFSESSDTWEDGTDSNNGYAAPSGYSWDDEGDRRTDTRCCADPQCSIAFQMPLNTKRLNLIYRTDQDGCTAQLTIAEGAGYVEVYNGSSWVEANNFQFSMNYTDVGSGYGNSEWQKRLKLRSTTGQLASSKAITVAKVDVNGSHFMYWGIEYTEDDFIFNLLNMARGGHGIETFDPDQLVEYLNTDVYDRDPNLVIFSIPIWNMGGNTYDEQTLEPNELSDEVEELVLSADSDSFATNSSNFADWECAVIMPHVGLKGSGAVDILNTDDTWRFWTETTNNRHYSVQDYFRSCHELFLENSSVAYLSVFEMWIQDARRIYGSLYKGISPSSPDGSTLLTSDGFHPNNNGCKLYLKYLLGLFNSSQL